MQLPVQGTQLRARDPRLVVGDGYPGLAAEQLHGQLHPLDLIENAERSNPHCLCGAHMIAVAHDDRVWLECTPRNTERQGLSSILARLKAQMQHRTKDI